MRRRIRREYLELREIETMEDKRRLIILSGFFCFKTVYSSNEQITS